MALIDDIATMLDDVAVMSKVAVKKTAGVLGDDLALNAEQVAGVATERELPVVWAVAKGSMLNKAILVPAALAISFTVPAAITPLLMLGGLFLCFEGVEKLAHKLLHSKAEDESHEREVARALADPKTDLVAFEKEKIRGAVRTDFVLSAEIIVITLGSVGTAAFGKQVATLCAIAVIMTVGVYGLVAAIVKLDDFGFYMKAKSGAAQQAVGRLTIAFAPRLMRSLSVIGTAAMFMVGGGILTHGVTPVHHVVEAAGETVATTPLLGGLIKWLVTTLLQAGFGVACGAAVLGILVGVRHLKKRL